MPTDTSSINANILHSKRTFPDTSKFMQLPPARIDTANGIEYSVAIVCTDKVAVSCAAWGKPKCFTFNGWNAFKVGLVARATQKFEAGYAAMVEPLIAEFISALEALVDEDPEPAPPAAPMALKPEYMHVVDAVARNIDNRFGSKTQKRPPSSYAKLAHDYRLENIADLLVLYHVDEPAFRHIVGKAERIPGGWVWVPDMKAVKQAAFDIAECFDIKAAPVVVVTSEEIPF